MIVSLGAIGFGLVWGWLLGFYDVRPEKAPVVLVSLTGASALGAGATAWVAGFAATPHFAIAALIALFVHSQWRSELRKRYGKSS